MGAHGSRLIPPTKGLGSSRGVQSTCSLESLNGYHGRTPLVECVRVRQRPGGRPRAAPVGDEGGGTQGGERLWVHVGQVTVPGSVGWARGIQHLLAESEAGCE